MSSAAMARFSWLLLLAGFSLGAARTLGQPSPSEAVQRVQEQLEAAAKQDEDANEKAGCFCQTNLAEKQQTVDNMQQQLTQLSHDIDESQARISQLDVEVKMHSDELSQSTNALSTAEAIREKDASKFNEEEQSHTQSIGQLQSALDAIEGRGSVGAALIAVREVTKRISAGSQQTPLLQMQQALRGKNSPAEVSGVLKHMVTSFSRDLQELRDDEVESKAQHEAIVDAKSQEIKSQKKNTLLKQQRLAKTKVTLGFNQQIKERGQKLLDANIQMLNSLKGVCQSSDDSFATRKEEFGAMTESLSSAQAELAGASLLSVGQNARDDGDAEKICSVAIEIVEKSWKERAQSACQQARQGDTASKQGAADTIEQLESDIRQAEDEAARKQDDCSNEHKTAQEDASTAAKEDAAEASFVGSEQQTAEEQIQDLTTQGEHADKAKSDYSQVTAGQQKAVQTLRVAISSGKDLLTHAANKANQPSAMKINEAIGQFEKLMTDANGFASGLQSKSQEFASACDNVRLLAGKVMIPLRLMKADSEEAAIAIKENSESDAKARVVPCNAAKLGADVAKLKNYRSMLGKAAESLAWESLR